MIVGAIPFGGMMEEHTYVSVNSNVIVMKFFRYLCYVGKKKGRREKGRRGKKNIGLKKSKTGYGR